MRTLFSFTCFHCKKIFQRKKGFGSSVSKNKFCSRSCNALHNVAGKNKQEKVQLFCQRCGNEYFLIPKLAKNSKYCSRICHNRSNSEKMDRNGNKNPGWKGGIQAYRRIGWAHFEKKCSICGSENNVEIHHINENRYDNRIENLKPVCRKCHQEIDGRSKRDKNNRFISRDVSFQPERV